MHRGMTAFLGSWMAMMVPMMLPSLVPMLWRRTRVAHVMALVSTGYFLVWAVYGVFAYALSPALASLAPAATGVVMLLAGGVQVTGWKVRQVARCWDALGAPSPWRQGLVLGFHCALCCSGYMIVLLVTGVMHLGFMALIGAAITIERLSPAPRRFARTAGAVIILTGVVLLVRPG